MIRVIVPIRILSEANGREHWRAKAKRTGRHRGWAHTSLIGQPKPAPPLVITLTRIAPRTLDDDNLASGFKAARDGVADWLGIDDGDKRLTWCYEQRRGERNEYCAEVRIESEFPLDTTEGATT